jgi:hypothetical protein
MALEFGGQLTFASTEKMLSTEKILDLLAVCGLVHKNKTHP